MNKGCLHNMQAPFALLMTRGFKVIGQLHDLNSLNNWLSTNASTLCRHPLLC